MKFGIEWDESFSGSIEEHVKLIKKHGFDAAFIGLDEPDLDEILFYMKKYDVKCENFHAPYNGINEIWKVGESGDETLARLCGCIDLCAKHQMPVLVVHLSSGMKPPRMSDVGFDRLDSLMKYADEKGVTLAFENIRRLDNVAYMLENYPQAGFCWDVGHEACYMNGTEFMPLFGKRMVALHLHDNTAVYDADLHMLPFYGNIDMEKAAKHIANSPYQGSIMLEVKKRHTKIETYEQFYATAYEIAKRFAGLVEKYKNA